MRTAWVVKKVNQHVPKQGIWFCKSTQSQRSCGTTQIKINNKMNTKLYAGNLSFDATQDDLQSLFETYGEVKDTFVVKDRESGRSRGFAFVTMETKESMDAAIKALNGEEFMGRALTINEARPREERSRR